MVDLRMPYNMIIGRLFLRTTRAVESIHYLKVKFRAGDVIEIIKESQKEARLWFAVSFKSSYYLSKCLWREVLETSD